MRIINRQMGIRPTSSLVVLTLLSYYNTGIKANAVRNGSTVSGANACQWGFVQSFYNFAATCMAEGSGRQRSQIRTLPK
jgi:hypothetical protein